MPVSMETKWFAAVAVLCLSLVTSAAAADIQGKVAYSVDGFNVIQLKPGSVTELLLTSPSGEQLRSFADKDGRFTLYDVSPGTYVLTTQNLDFIYPEVRDHGRSHVSVPLARRRQAAADIQLLAYYAVSRAHMQQCLMAVTFAQCKCSK